MHLLPLGRCKASKSNLALSYLAAARIRSPSSRAGANWRLRSFTAAGAEVFGAGHNALGAWWWLAQAGELALSASARAIDPGEVIELAHQPPAH